MQRNRLPLQPQDGRKNANIYASLTGKSQINGSSMSCRSLCYQKGKRGSPYLTKIKELAVSVRLEQLSDATQQAAVAAQSNDPRKT